MNAVNDTTTPLDDVNVAESTTTDAIDLTVLQVGDRGRLHVADTCEDCEYLNALGMTDQCKFRVCKVGTPCIVQVGGTRIGLSPDVARQIKVTQQV